MNTDLNNKTSKTGNKGITLATLNRITNENKEFIFIPLHSGKVTTLKETIEAMEREGD